jgi:hypothetical protein
MAIYFVSAASSTPGAVSTPNNGNDGLCPIGIAAQSTSPSYNTSTRTITDPGFGNILGDNSIAGCLVYINWGGATGGVNGLYEVESNNLGLQTVVLKPATGLATVNTTALTFSDGPWATLTYMASATPIASAGGDDHRIVRTNWEDGTELVYRGTTANFTWGNNGTAANRIRVASADFTGKPSLFPVKLGGSTSSGGATPILTLPGSLVYVTFILLEFVGGSGGGGAPTTGVTTGASNADITFRACVARNVSSHGFSITSSASRVNCVDCWAYSCGGSGFAHSATGNSHLFSGCCSWGNTANGFSVTGVGLFTMDDCVAFANTGDGYNLNASVTAGVFSQCMAAFNTGDGFEFASGSATRIVYCSSSNNGGWGFNATSPISSGRIGSFPNNHAFGNSSGAVGPAGSEATYLTNILISTGDPRFTSTVTGALDLNPTTGSPLLNSGYNRRLGQSIDTPRNIGGTQGGGGASGFSPPRNRF